MLITLPERAGIDLLWKNPYYWIAFGFTYVVGVLVVLYMRMANLRLSEKYGIDESVGHRIRQQLLWCMLLVPLAVVTLLAVIFSRTAKMRYNAAIFAVKFS